MCIIVYKPKNVNFPNKKTLKNCFENNPDGAGFMYTSDGVVNIKKGYKNFSSFYKALQDSRKETGDSVPYVLHFRISTQAGTRQDCCHPFPLSAKMDDLRLLESATKIGIAHNGIISLTSESKAGLTYSDTMRFITEYLSLIIQDKNFYKNKKTLKLIERLIDSSRLAILDEDGNGTTIGKGWTIDNDIYYSNTSYKASLYTKLTKTTALSYCTSYDYDEEYYYNFEKYYNALKGGYDFPSTACPCSLYDDYEYCDYCLNFGKCYGITNSNSKRGDNN